MSKDEIKIIPKYCKLDETQTYVWKTALDVLPENDIEKTMRKEAFKMLTSNEKATKSGCMFTSDIPFEVLDEINLYCLVSNTNDCYVTNGGITIIITIFISIGLTSDGGLIDERKPWKIKTEYKNTLIEIATKYKLSYELVHSADMCFRMKSARGYKWCIVKVTNEPKATIFLSDKTYYKLHRIGRPKRIVPLIIKS